PEAAGRPRYRPGRGGQRPAGVERQPADRVVPGGPAGVQHPGHRPAHRRQGLPPGDRLLPQRQPGPVGAGRHRHRRGGERQGGRATIIPSLALPVSVVGTFGVMYLLDYTMDNLSLLALTLAVGFVVDDAIVMLENIARHLDTGKTPLRAALDGSAEVGFTIVSMTVSLVAVFIPVL